MSSKPLTKTSDLVNPTQLGKEFGRPNQWVQAILAEADLHAVVTMPYGRGFLRMYEPGPARDAIRAKLSKPAVGAQEVRLPPPSVCLDVLEERVETLCAEVAKLQAQNIVLLRTLESMKGGVETLVQQLGVAV